MRHSLSRRDFLAALAVTPVAARAGAQTRRAAPAASPLQAFDAARQAVRAVADKYARALPAGGELRLEGRDGAFVPSLVRASAARGLRGQSVPADGLLVFAIDVSEPTYVSGELLLLPDANLRPGLRAAVLSDDTLVGAPMIVANDWGTPTLTAPAPRVLGRRPTRSASLAEWLLPVGRHYLTVAGPHTRAAGAFQGLTVQTRTRAVREPIYTFAFIADTHVSGPGPRREAMNRVMSDAAAPALRATLEALSADGVAFALVGGDMTEHGTREEFDLLAATASGTGCQVYACLGDHDVSTPSSRADAIELLGARLPDAAPDYSFTKAPIRFIVMEPFGDDPEIQAKKQQWLVAALGADRRTPTMFVWHGAPYHRGGISSCGFTMPEQSARGRQLVLDVLQRAPNVFATLNGQGHWDEVDYLGGIAHIQNAAFAEWPNSYRVFRVYSDRVEWEVRQVANRGLVQESLIPAKALTWMAATRETDTTGQAMLRRPAPSA